MLTSSANQYLHPEYITPLPTTLDAKKSPLALLAQTCSQIGVDPPTSSKSLLTPLDKSGKSSSSSSSKSSSDSSSSRDKASPSSNNNNNNNNSNSNNSGSSSSSSSSSSVSENCKPSSFKPYESCVTRDKLHSPEQQQQQRVPSAHSNPGSNGSSRSRTPAKRCSSNQSASSGRAITPQQRESPSTRLATSSSHSPSGMKSTNSTVYSSIPAAFSSPDYRLSTTASAGNATTTTTPSAAAYGLPFPPQSLPPHMDPMMASLMSLKSGLAGNPYLGYARVKTATGADTLVPVCRDPYCTGCPLSSHLLGAGAPPPPTSTSSSSSGVTAANGTKQTSSPCPAGCSQCDHSKATSAAAAAAAAAASSPYAAYAAHAQLVALAASQLPYACSFVGSDATYCGKRFASTDELMQHYRSHAAPGDSGLSLLGPPHHLLSRSYPTPPLSPSLANARYHPYKAYGGAPGLSSLGLPLPPPHPYFSPYSLYAAAAGSRLGAATGMHP